MVFWNNLGWYEVEPRSQHAVHAQPLFCLRVHSVPLVFLKSDLAVSVEGLPLSNVSVLFQTHAISFRKPFLTLTSIRRAVQLFQATPYHPVSFRIAIQLLAGLPSKFH